MKNEEKTRKKLHKKQETLTITAAKKWAKQQTRKHPNKTIDELWKRKDKDLGSTETTYTVRNQTN